MLCNPIQAILTVPHAMRLTSSRRLVCITHLGPLFRLRCIGLVFI
jgi:hypothetical protein